MKEFIIEDSFWEIFPEAKIGVVLCKEIDNRIKDTEKYEKLLRNAEKEIIKYLSNQQFSKNEVISVWREAFKKFKTKKGARASIEALFKRVSKGNQIPTINPLVDLYNAVSLKYALPCGGEDIDTFEGNMRLTQAEGDEPFVTLGSNKNEPPYPKEVIYKDDAGAICRCWNWRESVRTLLTEKTKNAFICIESVEQESNDRLESALEELKNLVKLHLNADCSVHLLNIENKKIKIHD